MNAPVQTKATRLSSLLREFKLTVAADEMVGRLVQAGHDDAMSTLVEVFELEREVRHERRVARLRRASKLPAGKTFETFDDKRLSRAVMRQLTELQASDFIDTATNVLAFGLPGVGKSHAIAALGHALVQQGRSVLWTPTYTLVQELLAAKRDLDLPRKLRKPATECLPMTQAKWCTRQRRCDSGAFSKLTRRQARPPGHRHPTEAHWAPAYRLGTGP